jgi:hypothetical protein
MLHGCIEALVVSTSLSPRHQARMKLWRLWKATHMRRQYSVVATLHLSPSPFYGHRGSHATRCREVGVICQQPHRRSSSTRALEKFAWYNTRWRRLPADPTWARQEIGHMAEFPSPHVPLVPGYTGLPVHTESTSPGPPPGSVEWLLDAIERHAAAEADALAQYEYVSKASGDPVVAFVMRLILEDEERHHGLLKRMEATLRDALDWTRSPNALPSSGVPEAPVEQHLAESVGSLIHEENTGARYMRELARQEEAVGADLHALLLEMMAQDSEKHAKLLGFVRVRLAARSQTDEGAST